MFLSKEWIKRLITPTIWLAPKTILSTVLPKIQFIVN